MSSIFDLNDENRNILSIFLCTDNNFICHIRLFLIIVGLWLLGNECYHQIMMSIYNYCKDTHDIVCLPQQIHASFLLKGGGDIVFEFLFDFVFYLKWRKLFDWSTVLTFAIIMRNLGGRTVLLL